VNSERTLRITVSETGIFFLSRSQLLELTRLFLNFKRLKIVGRIAVFFLILSLACTKKAQKPQPEISGPEYYPSASGRFVVYEVDSVIYTDLPKDTITYKYRIKEKLADSFTDNSGKPAQRLERFIKVFNPKIPYDSMQWKMKEVWMVNIDERGVQVVESNIRYTKLSFPVIENASWNGNAYNTLPEWNYTYEYIDKAEKINGYDLQTLKVKQKEFRTLISYENYCEKYAKGVGLVYREMQNIHSNNIVAGVPVEKRIEKGSIYKQTLLSYGHE
jgi:hypothetical protein